MAHKPTDLTRRFVETCVIGGIPQKDIAGTIGISRTTLAKHYVDEISRSKTRAHAKVVQTAFKLATSGKCPAMTMFWLKTQCQWRETNHHEVTVATDLDKMTPNERRELIREQSRKLMEIEESVGDVADLKGLPE